MARSLFSQDKGYGSKPYKSNYNLVTPWRAIASASYVFREIKDTRKQRAFLSADIEYVNYKGSYGNTNLDFNCMIGAKYWKSLGRNICQFVSSSAVPISSTGSHNKRYRWGFQDMSSGYGFQNVYGISDETSTGSPGFYSYHATGGWGLTTYDNDQDVNGGNCSTYYNNAPWWYGGCWDGNAWGGMGNGYADAYFWSGSGGDYFNYGAIYIGG